MFLLLIRTLFRVIVIGILVRIIIRVVIIVPYWHDGGVIIAIASLDIPSTKY